MLSTATVADAVRDLRWKTSGSPWPFLRSASTPARRSTECEIATEDAGVYHGSTAG